MRLLCILFCLSVYCPAIAIAQETDIGEANFSSVLTIDISRIARETQYGQRIFKEFENAQGELIESNIIIQNNLESEEQSLVELRKTLAADEFRKLAVEFDERANAIRKERAALENTLFEIRDENINKLLQLSVPFLQEIMLSYKASVIIDRRNIVLSNPMIDITEKAIELINDKLGDGTKNAD
jgi:Skp family chaperone for outer membrane proteins